MCKRIQQMRIFLLLYHLALRISDIVEIMMHVHLPWPKYRFDKNGFKIKCKRDEDCPFPERCCEDPIFPADNFCCTNYGTRKLIPAYAKTRMKR